MQITIPITITKEGAHLVSVPAYSSSVNVLGYQKDDGSIVLFKTGNAAVILDQSGKINIGVDYNETYCFFGQESEQAYEELADQYEWMEPSLTLSYNNISVMAIDTVYIADPESGDNLLVAYDVFVGMDKSNIALPLDVFIPEITADIDTAFVTTCEVGGRQFLALSVSGIVRPIYDIMGNGGCPVTADGGTFNVSDCNDVGAAGVSMSEIPLQVALGNKWSARSCSMDNSNVTTFLRCGVYMLDAEFNITTEVITAPAGTWYIQPSQFTVNEA